MGDASLGGTRGLGDPPLGLGHLGTSPHGSPHEVPARSKRPFGILGPKLSMGKETSVNLFSASGVTPSVGEQ